MTYFLKETFLAIFCFIALLYILFSFGNGSFDYSTWAIEARQALATTCGGISMIVLMIQALRYL